MTPSESRRRELAVEYAKKPQRSKTERLDYEHFGDVFRGAGSLGVYHKTCSATNWAAGHRAATDEHRALREAVRALAWALTRERVKELCKQLAMPAEWEAAVVEVIDSEEES